MEENTLLRYKATQLLLTAVRSTELFDEIMNVRMFVLSAAVPSTFSRLFKSYCSCLDRPGLMENVRG